MKVVARAFTRVWEPDKVEDQYQTAEIECTDQEVQETNGDGVDGKREDCSISRRRNRHGVVLVARVGVEVRAAAHPSLEFSEPQPAPSPDSYISATSHGY